MEVSFLCSFETGLAPSLLMFSVVLTSWGLIRAWTCSASSNTKWTHDQADCRITIDCHIGMNSIHNSLFARTCMMSRATYKGLKIEWYEDECSLPLPEPKQVLKENTMPNKKPRFKAINRFEMLGIDGNDTEDGADDDVEDDVTTTTNMTSLTLDARTPWDASSSVGA